MLKYKRLIYLKICNWNFMRLVSILILIYGIVGYNLIDENVLQNSYAIEKTDDKDKVKNQQDDEKDNKDSKEAKGEESENKNGNKGNSIFNFVAVGDWDCTSETEDTVDNIINQDPELVLALGDFSYSGDAGCWFDLIEPIADKTKIVMGNHEDEDDYMDYFGLKNQYYSFNEKNIHFLHYQLKQILMKILNNINLQNKILKNILKIHL